jgi:hypothetical protein
MDKKTMESLFKTGIFACTLVVMIGCSSKIFDGRFDGEFLHFQKKKPKEKYFEVPTESHHNPIEQEEEKEESSGWFW